MDDIDIYDKMIKGEELSFTELRSLNKTRIDRVRGWLISSGLIGKAFELRMLFLGAMNDISSGYRRPLI